MLLDAVEESRPIAIVELAAAQVAICTSKLLLRSGATCSQALKAHPWNHEGFVVNRLNITFTIIHRQYHMETGNRHPLLHYRNGESRDRQVKSPTRRIYPDSTRFITA